jgi:hypothetical protein
MIRFYRTVRIPPISRSHPFNPRPVTHPDHPRAITPVEAVTAAPTARGRPGGPRTRDRRDLSAGTRTAA